jgi:hypothetical protein
MYERNWLAFSVLALLPLVAIADEADQEKPPVTAAMVDGSGPGWIALGEEDFVQVNSADDTWSFKDGTIYCTGKPTSVMRAKKIYTNFELVVQWRHMRNAGNSGIFVWTTEDSIKRLTDAGKPGLPHGIEVQVLDLGYAEHYVARHKKDPDWFTSHGDVFPVGRSRMKPFPPIAPNGTRSFPSKELSRGVGQWNHYYVRAINGEIRLWVNGEEVSGGAECDPASGYLCLESEGSPVEFRGLKVRELP